MCLDLAIDNDVGLQDGTLLMLWECNDSQQQNFMWEDDGTIRSAVNDQMCVEVPDGDPDNGRELWMWECNGGSQYWSYGKNPANPSCGALLYAPNGDWTMGNNARCIDIVGGRDAGGGNGGTLLTGPCSEKNNDGEPWIGPDEPLVFTASQVV